MKHTENNNFLGKEKIGTLLAKYSIPCVVSLLVTSLYNIVDQLFVGNSDLGYLGNAAIGAAFPITVIALAFALCLGDGCAAYMSLAQGKHNDKSEHLCVGNALLTSFAISVVLTAVCAVYKEPLLRMFGASDLTVGMANDYFTIILAAFPVFMLVNTMNSIIRADGSPSFAFAATAIGAAFNVALDPLLIFKLNLGIKGAAYVTVISQLISFIVSFAYFFKAKSFRLTSRSFKPDAELLWSCTKFGVSSFVTQLSIVAVSLVCGRMFSKYGAMSVYGADIPVSAFGVETKIYTVIIGIVSGIVTGAQPIFGYNFGAGEYGRVRRLFKAVVLLTLAVTLPATAVFVFVPELVVNMFGKGTELYMEFSRIFLRIFLSLITFTSIIKVISVFLQSVGQPVKAAVISVLRDIALFVPLALILPRHFGINGVLYAAPIADIIAMVITLAISLPFFASMKRLSLQSKDNCAQDI